MKNDKKDKNEDNELDLEPMSFIEYIKHIFSHRKKHKHNHNDDNSTQRNSPPMGATIYTIAIIIDNEVVEVVRAEGRLAAIFLSDPDFVEITDDYKDNMPTIGWKYNGTVFEKPEE